MFYQIPQFLSQMRHMVFPMKKWYTVCINHIQEFLLKMRQVSKKIYFYKYIAGKTKYTRHSYCGTKTGWHCCCRYFRETDFAQYGAGIALYF